MFRFAATSTLALCIGAGAAMAELTPAQVWENLQQTYAGYGYEISGQTEDAGGTLTVSNAAFLMKGEGATSTVTVPRLTFQETGDARVRMVIEGDIALSSTFMMPVPPKEQPAPAEGATGEAAPEPAAPEMVEMTMTGTVKMPGNETVISGTPEDMVYEYDYPTVDYALTMPADPETGVAVPIGGALTGVSGTQRQVTADGTATTFDVKAAEATLRTDVTTPPGADGNPGGTVGMQIRIADPVTAGTVRTPAGQLDLGSQMPQALAAGLDIQGSFGFSGAEMALDLAGKDETGADQTGKGSVRLGAGEASVQLTSQGLGYKTAVQDSQVDMTVSTMPFPLSYAARRTSLDLLIPVSKAEAAQPFRLAYVIEGLTMADAIWNLFDPNSQLPRDPASLTIDLSGDAVVARDLFEPASAQRDAASEQSPLAPRTLTVNKVSLDAAGAKADISGALDFSANPEQPVGKLNGTFSGVNGLMDKLVAMGLVPQDQMTGMRMMLTMFARPVEGNPDQLTSELEFREGGSIFANGQQVR